MEARFRSPQNPLEWLLAIAVLGVVISLGMVLLGVVIVGVAAAIVAAPVIGWWRSKKRVAPPPREPTPIEDPEGPVVEAEFKIKNESED
jgi:hypothetical protein